MKHWTIGAVLIIASAIVLTVYPIYELTRYILLYPQYAITVKQNSFPVITNLELFLMWWAYLSMPFFLWAILREMKRGKDAK